jgi:RNA polymerase sigma-70 factor (ECF subfamily)
MAGPMDVSDPRDLTQLLRQWRQGDQRAFEVLAPRVDAELRRLASRYMRRERPEHTLQPTALVNEAWLRLAGGSQPDYENRSHFVGIAAQHMRHILVEHARRRQAQKRGSGVVVAGLEDIEVASPDRPTDLVALDDGLKALAQVSSRQVQVVELHYFGGMTFEEVAGLLGIGRSTVIRDLKLAQMWLKDFVAA